MEYAEDDYLMISGIQHFRFCKRQWALIHIEQQWAENEHTVIGELMHKKAHDPYLTEKRRYYERRYTPKVKMGKHCTSCSLKEICMPRLAKTGSVKNYMDQVLMEENV